MIVFFFCSSISVAVSASTAPPVNDASNDFSDMICRTISTNAVSLFVIVRDSSGRTGKSPFARNQFTIRPE